MSDTLCLLASELVDGLDACEFILKKKKSVFNLCQTLHDLNFYLVFCSLLESPYLQQNNGEETINCNYAERLRTGLRYSLICRL